MVGPNVAIREAGRPKTGRGSVLLPGCVRRSPRAVGEDPAATILTMIVFADGSKVTDRADPPSAVVGGLTPRRITRTGSSNGASPGWDCIGLLDPVC